MTAIFLTAKTKVSYCKREESIDGGSQAVFESNLFFNTEYSLSKGRFQNSPKVKKAKKQITGKNFKIGFYLPPFPLLLIS